MTRTVTLVGYGIAGACALALELAARRGGRVATFGAALTGVLRRPPLRVLVQAGWLWLGWHLFARVEW